MLEWITGQNEQFADNSKVLEPPETPAPVFAIRAFKSALFGTPGADDEDQMEREPNQKNLTANQLSRANLSLKPTIGNTSDAPIATKADIDMAVNAMASPTKSILVTPGTASNRRKTVSFGDGVVDNERKRGESPNKSSRTPLTSQWSINSSDGKAKPRSKLTQALMDSRDKSPKESEASQNPQSTEPKPVAQSASSTEDDTGDDTINLNEPRSQSGKYWKAEFDSYRTKTTQEIRKLIQYRSAAKAYARKKDEEALRLAEKLKEEEVKVSEMERHVTQLASTMVGENSKADKEQLVQELTKQTALALQYKHRVGLLRKLLEQHGVVNNDVENLAGSSETANDTSGDTAEELRKAQQALGEANAKLEEMKREQSEFTKLKDLAQSSEQKASNLEKENATLKQTLARVKQEMTKYEGRRKEKEAKLKQREAKLELRVQEYRERLKSTSQQHREQEDGLRESFNDERRRMQDQIDLLKLKLTTFERLPELRSRTRHSDKGYTGVQVYDFGQDSPQKEQHDETQDMDEPPSPSPRAKDRRSHTTRTVLGELDVKRASKALGLETEDHSEQLAYLDDTPHKPKETHHLEGDDIPPSSPPGYQPLEPPTRRTSRQRYNPENYHSYVPTHSTITSLAHHLATREDSKQIRTERLRARRSPSKYSLDAITGLPQTYHLPDRTKRRQSLASVQRDSIPVERMLAAQARLKRKQDNRKIRQEGKENMIRA
ncbi:spindle pole body formation-associated protein-domain-containing protein [Aspergillus pseudotamarii]|uniref:Spindle pole body formation-associated protein-domain-containing protein n=1 Tax=Aspergillus pseudotamarii TaxID=132259 RepID=A0A5N6T799_ASPPS|nr:spindle pole body formation-associated protein-domain-containing protein [Aspergillus pseudotamarii]KAE8142244.1 spindle pole body formation-associated protein-domain-containing protein [Aspergillus pseudotamarii]